MAKPLVYQLYAPAWPNLRLMTRHLRRIASLGANIVWVSGILMSPQYDHGYDVSDYLQIEPKYGSMEDFQDFIDIAHTLKLQVIIDLVLNHTSTGHRWFQDYPSYYCWSSNSRPGWKNLFDGGPAWKYVEKYDQYYLHSFHEKQADLNWFPEESEELNQALVYEFRDIVDFWVKKHKVDGFKIDPQAINKDFTRHTLDVNDLLLRKKAAEVLNAIFPNPSHPLLIAGIFDPTFGDIVDYYTNETPIDYVINLSLKESVAEGPQAFLEHLQASVANPKLMVSIEDHNGPRANFKGLDSIWYSHKIFMSNAQAICLFQGQELGLCNPSISQLSDKDMLRLDAQTATQYARGKDLNTLRPTSRANTRIALPLDVYIGQEESSASCLNLFRLQIKSWRIRR